MMATDLVIYSYEQGKHILEKRQSQILKEYGQFLTPPSVAKYMARQLGDIRTGTRLLEPAIGSGVLVCAIIEQIISQNLQIEIWIDAYEIDGELCEVARQVLSIASKKADEKGIKNPLGSLSGRFCSCLLA